MKTFILHPNGTYQVRIKKKTFVLAGAKRAHLFALGIAKQHPKVTLLLQGDDYYDVTPVWQGGFATENRWL